MVLIWDGYLEHVPHAARKQFEEELFFFPQKLCPILCTQINAFSPIVSLCQSFWNSIVFSSFSLGGCGLAGLRSVLTQSLHLPLPQKSFVCPDMCSPPPPPQQQQQCTLGLRIEEKSADKNCKNSPFIVIFSDNSRLSEGRRGSAGVGDARYSLLGDPVDVWADQMFFFILGRCNRRRIDQMFLSLILGDAVDVKLIKPTIMNIAAALFGLVRFPDPLPMGRSLYLGRLCLSWSCFWSRSWSQQF